MTTSPNKEKRDIRTVFFIFSVISFVLACRSPHPFPRHVLIAVGILLPLLAVVSPMTLRPAFRLWLKTAHMIGRVNVKVLLLVIFVFILVPAGLIMRLSGKDPMQRRTRSGSFWEPYEIAGIRDKSRYERLY